MEGPRAFRIAAVAVLALVILAAAAVGQPAREPADNEFPIVLGSFSTTLVGSLPERTHNLLLCARALDGLVLEPGAVVSFNRVVGPRTVERGFQRAPVILREVRGVQLGGGICQAASTLFAAALVSGLWPVERHRHSSPVDYIPLGQDATISWGAKDLRLQNVLDQRVRLRVELLGSTLSARFEGEQALEGRYELACDEHEIDDGGTGGLPGREIELYRVHLVGGQEVEREFVHRDLYPVSHARPVEGTR